MVTVCAWHLGGRLRGLLFAFLGFDISHGICASCAKKF